MITMSYLLITLSTMVAQTDEVWVGKGVLPKRGIPNLSTIDDNGKVSVISKFPPYPGRVMEEKGEWLRL